MAVERLGLPFHGGIRAFNVDQRYRSVVSRFSAVGLDRFDVAFVGVLLVFVALALPVVLSSSGLLGADVANYLVTMRQVFGDDPTGLGLQRPPLIALPLRVATAILPVITATKVMAVLAWASTGFPVFRVMRRIAGGNVTGDTVSVFAGAAFLASTTFAAMMVWGWITFLGIALMALIAWIIVRNEGLGSWKWSIVLGVALAVLAATHQVSLFISVLWLAGYGATLLALRRRDEFMFLVKAALAFGALAVWLLPIYLSMMSNAAGESASVGIRSLGEIGSSLEFFYQSPGYFLWLMVGALSIYGLVILYGSTRTRPAALLMGSMLLVLFALLLGPGVWGVRSLYYAYFPIWVLAAVGITGLLRFVPKPGVTRLRAVNVGIAIFVSVGLVAAVGTVWMHSQFQNRLGRAVNFFDLVDEDHLAASEYAASLADGSSFIAHPFYVGWWLEGGLGINALEISRFTNRVQNDQAHVAESVLTGNHVIENGLVSLGDSFPDPVEGTPQVWIALPNGKRAGEKVAQSYFDNGATILTVVDDTGSLSEISLQSMAGDLDLDSSGNRLSLDKRFTRDDLIVSQEISVESERFGWKVGYDFQGGRDVVSARIPIYFAAMTDFRHVKGSADFKTTQILKGTSVVTTVTVTATNADVESIPRDLPGSGQSHTLGQAWINVVPHGDRFSVDLSFDIEGLGGNGDLLAPTGQALETTVNRLEYSNARDLINQHNIGYVFVSNLPRFVTRRLDESPGFEPLRLQDGISIYKVHPARFDNSNTVAAQEHVANWLELQQFRDLSEVDHWGGLRVSNVRKAFPNGSLSNFRVITADVSLEPGKWSGMVFTSRYPIRAKDVNDLRMQLRWGSAERTQSYSIALEDKRGRRWAWYQSPSESAITEDGWQFWEMSRSDAQRQDEGFDWNRVWKVHVSQLTLSEVKRSETSLEIGAIGGFFPLSVEITGEDTVHLQVERNTS